MSCMPFFGKAMKVREVAPVWNAIHEMRIEFGVALEPFVVFGDHEGAWSGEVARDYIRDNGGEIKQSVPNRDESKGIMEIHVRIYLEACTAMLYQSGFPAYWWY
ncbi:MAG: hypothetical protein VX239_04015, partial [Candidatus Thermoplasmatota archaeon]|nr:hypothetical protein [Candidatus Thermoplasmatota archaeon]